LVDFKSATSAQQQQSSGTTDPNASSSGGEFGIQDEDDPFADGL
jgi:hypothetical protein